MNNEYKALNNHKVVMGVQTLILKGNFINVRIYFDRGLLDYVEVLAVKEVKKIRETIKLNAFPARSIGTNRLHDLLIIEHKYIEDGTEVFAEKYSIEDYSLSVLRVFNEQIGVKYRDRVLAGTLSFDEANEYISKFLDYIDVIHTQRRFHELIEIVKESLNSIYDFDLFP